MEAFKASIKAFENNPVLQEFWEEIRVVPPGKTEEICKDYPICSARTIYYKLQMEQMRVYAERRERQRCVAHHMQACLALKQFEYILNVTEYVNENYLRVKEKFLRAIDYVEDINVDEPPTTDSTSRHKRNSENLLHEVTQAFDKSEVGLILAVGVRKLHEYQCLKGKRDEEDILPYSQLEKRFGANRRTIIECSQGYKYRYPKGVPTKVQFTLSRPE